MYLLSLAAAVSSGGMATLSQGFLTAGMGLVAVMTLAYLWYTLGSARLAGKLATERVVNRKSATSLKNSQAVNEQGGVATLVRSDVILHEQPDGEQPIALNRGLIAIGRVGSTLGWLAVGAFLLGLVLRAIVEQHVPWSNLYEFSMSFTTALLICYLVFEARYHERVRAWGLYVCVLAVVTLGIAVYLGLTYNMISDTQALIPALQDKTILAIHVSVAIFAYAL
ncbi:MAG: hypothetical protein ACRDHW_01725, partial [Ktedonobacteraceae bacterium]